jgi:hypothetical protein
MRGKVVAIFSVAAGILLFSVGSFAHHGASVVYDLNQKVTMTGTVTDYQFVNPHVLIFFEVTGEGGTVVVWSAGLTSPNRLARSDGWSRGTLKPPGAARLRCGSSRSSSTAPRCSVVKQPLAGPYAVKIGRR